MSGHQRPEAPVRALGPRPAARSIFPWLLAALSLCLSVPARAQQSGASAGDKAAAESLFDRGLNLMREQRFEEACKSLEQSQAIEAGIGTMLYLAECYEQLGRTASAWALFREAASRAQAAGQTARAEAGKQRALALEGKLSTLKLSVSKAAAVEGLRVVRDDGAVNPGLWNLPVPIDPGTHQLSADAPGYETWAGQVTISENSHAVVEIPVLKAAPNAEVARAAASEPATLPANIEAPSPDGRSQKLWLSTWVVGGASAAALVVGSAFGIRAINKNNDAKDFCDGDVCRERRGQTLSDQAMDAGRVSNGFFLTGAVLAVGTGTLYWFARKRESRPFARALTPHLAFDRKSISGSLGGTF